MQRRDSSVRSPGLCAECDVRLYLLSSTLARPICRCHKLVNLAVYGQYLLLPLSVFHCLGDVCNETVLCQLLQSARLAGEVAGSMHN